MADKFKVLSGKIENLPSNIDPGSVYFAMLNETTGVIYVDCRMADGTTRRIKMSSQNEGTLTIGEYTYNGTKDVVIPVYKGSLD